MLHARGGGLIVPARGRFFTLKTPGAYDIAYYDASSPSTSVHQLELFDRTLDDKEHPVALVRTLRSLLSPSGGEPNASQIDAGAATYFMYSDQPDSADPGMNYGHAKGVVGYSSAGAFWIVHSTPNFPSTSGSSKFYFPEGEVKFGQTFLCMSLAAADLDDVAAQLLYVAPCAQPEPNSRPPDLPAPRVRCVLAQPADQEIDSLPLAAGTSTSTTCLPRSRPSTPT